MFIFFLACANKALGRSHTRAFKTFGYKISFMHYENGANLTFKNCLSLSWWKKKTHWPWPLCSQIQASRRCSKRSACQAKSHSLSLVGIRFSAFCIKMMMMGSSNERRHRRSEQHSQNVMKCSLDRKRCPSSGSKDHPERKKIRRPAPHWQIYFSI